MLINRVTQIKDCVGIQTRYAILRTSGARLLAKVTTKVEDCLPYLGMDCSCAFAHLIALGDTLEELTNRERFVITNRLMGTALVCQMNIEGLNRRIDIIAAVPLHKLLVNSDVTTFSLESVTDAVRIQFVDVNAQFIL